MPLKRKKSICNVDPVPASVETPNTAPPIPERVSLFELESELEDEVELVTTPPLPLSLQL